MKIFAAFAVAAAVSAFAVPSFAADGVVSVDSVRIALAGKSDAQVRTEIRDAASTVCGALTGDCWANAVRKANADFSAISRARQPAAPAPVRAAKLEDGRATVASVRVALVGRSNDQIQADIAAAANTVCKATNDYAPDYRACVTGAVRSAQLQLRQLARLEGSSQVASM
ncbi:hypothetical protein [Phenylobacterium sp.]|uniref:hypothetical protein n=1 Tax=Phenylobacterium sp. TaxID=1871053 RepID=UPI0030F45091